MYATMSAARPDRWLVLALAITAVALGMRLHRITEWSLGNDEIAEVRWASGSFGEMIEEVRRDAVHPPLDYVLQHLLGRAGAPEWARRLPSAFAGAATVFLIYLLGRWWFHPLAGVVGAMLLALAANHLRYSQEVRPYSLAFFFIAFALVALERHSQTQYRRWAYAWGASVWLAGAWLYFGGVIAALTSLARMFVGRKDDLAWIWKRLPIFIVVWTLLYAPWLPTIFTAARYGSPQPAEELNWSWWQHRLQVFGTGDWKNEPVSIGSWAFWLAVIVGIVASMRHDRLRAATAWFVAGAAVTVLFLQLRPHYHTPRYLMPAWIGAFALAGAGFCVLLNHRATRMIGAALLASIVAFDVATISTYFRGERPDWRRVADYVYENVKPGQTVVATNNWVVRNFGWYWRMRPLPDGVRVERFAVDRSELRGPAWIVTGGCFPRDILKSATEVRARWPKTELAEARFLCDGCVLSRREEWCPE